MIKKALSIALIAAATSSCSSIISKNDYAVIIDSDPSQASFSITNREGRRVHAGLTPATVTLKSSSGYFKKETYTVNFEKQGWGDQSVVISSSVDGWYWGNLLFGGIIGMLVVDPATGSMFNLPERIDGLLAPQRTSIDQPDTLYLTSIDKLTEEQKEMLQPMTIQ